MLPYHSRAARPKRSSSGRCRAGGIASTGARLSLLHDHLTPLIPAGQVEPTAEALRTFTNGVVLSVAEHPADWPAARQRALLDRVLNAFGLDEVAETGSAQERQVRRRRGQAVRPPERANKANVRSTAR